MTGERRIVLVRFAWEAAEPDGLPAALAGSLVEGGFAAEDLVVHRALESTQACGYLYPAPDSRSIDDAAFERLRSALARQMPHAAAARLLALMEIDGASAPTTPTHHYVVETDVVPQGDAELNSWYDEEHLPGLAAVPGTVRAARYRNLDDGPRYHACYELASRETFGSPPWLDVRATDWSSRVRPMFLNTRRTMFRSSPTTGLD